MKLNELIAIDVHTHAEVSCRQEPDEAWKPFEEASAKYFKAGKRPNDPRDHRVLPRAQDRPGDVHRRFGVPDRRATHSQRGSGGRGAREQRHHDRVRQHRSAQGQDGRARGASARSRRA